MLRRNLYRGFLFVTIIVSTCTVSFSQSPVSNSCELSGEVFDRRDALVPNVEILFVKGGSYISTRANEVGRFGIVVNPGQYEILLRLPFDFWIYERSKITVDCRHSLEMNLYAPPMCVSYGCDPLGYSFDHFRRKDAPEDVEMVIAYSQRKGQKSKRNYRDAFLTLGMTTVFARELTVDLKERRVTALNGWVERGGTRSSFDDQNIELAQAFLRGKITSYNVSDRDNRRRLKKLSETLNLREVNKEQ